MRRVTLMGVLAGLWLLPSVTLATDLTVVERMDDEIRVRYKLAQLVTEDEEDEESSWWAKDSFRLTDDKVAHFAVGYASADLLQAMKVQDRTVLWSEAVFWVLWETKDALISWRKTRFGGDGFSIHDLVYSMLGVTGAVLVNGLANTDQ